MRFVGKTKSGRLGLAERCLAATCAGVAPACRPRFLTEASQSCCGAKNRLDRAPFRRLAADATGSKGVCRCHRKAKYVATG